MRKLVYFFGAGSAEGTRAMTSVLGGKGAGLAEMANLGVPVPPGFTIACEACMQFLRDGDHVESLVAEVDRNLARVEQATGRRFGDTNNPLLVSVRSGAPVSMPGMMETILNLGLNDKTVVGLARSSDNPRFAFDAYRRFLQMYGDVVLGIPSNRFEELLAEKRKSAAVVNDSQLTESALRSLVEDYKNLVRKETGAEFPMDAREQLWGAIKAVWKSWTLKKAVDYRRVNRISNDLGTAVNVVAMVFGNMGDDSGTGVAFTRNPSTGAREMYGEFLQNAQGEDIVAGIRTPRTIAEMATEFPSAYGEFLKTAERLESHFHDVQDVEFTVERGKLFMLQTRRGARTAAAAVRIAIDMVAEGLIDRPTAVKRVQPEQLNQLLHPVIDAKADAKAVCTGLPASPGAASGTVVFDPDVAEQKNGEGEKVILVRDETTPEDFHGIVAARAVLTARGGLTSHAAVVARGMGKCAVVGCSGITVDTEARQFRADGRVVKEGEWITLDGSTGRVFLGDIPTTPSEVMQVLHRKRDKKDAPVYGQFEQLLRWADDVRSLKVRANADTPADARIAREFGAEGIGLCRTEHMFFEGDRIQPMREMIVARDVAGRRRALEKLLPLQRQDFDGIFDAMSGLPVTIRLLDPPLHEFLPPDGKPMKELAGRLGMETSALQRIVETLREANPMLGHRGCRLGITYPEITEMQARAIFEAAVSARGRGIDVIPEIMIPLVADVSEFDHQRAIIDAVAEQVRVKDERVAYTVGTMIELPRAALTADRIAKSAEFFSFGTNDLTQTTFGLSRDDAGRFLPQYISDGLLRDDPFQTLDQDGVGKLMQIAISSGRASRQSLKVGICGEHGGDPRSVQFCHAAGMDYVSCSPYRVPIARLAAAHAALGA